MDAGLQRIPWGSDELLVSLLLVVAGVLAITLAGVIARRLVLPLLVGLLVRTLVAIVQRVSHVLPQGGADARGMETRAWQWSQAGCLDTMYLNMGGSHVHSWIMSHWHSCLGVDRAPLVFQLSNVLLGVYTIFVSALIARRIWAAEVAARVAWVMAFFPTLVVYSVVELREVYVTAFLMTGVYLIVRWMQDGSQHFFAMGVASIMGAAVFHGGMIFAIFGLCAFVFTVFIKHGLRVLSYGRLSKRWGGAAVLVVVGAFVLLVGIEDLRFSSIGDVTRLGERYKSLEERQDSFIRGSAEYPAWLGLEGASDLRIALLTPFRIVYLLFGPLPWDIRAPQHFVGMFDGLLYLAMVILLWQHRQLWWQKPELPMLLMMLIGLLLVFSWGTGNFGTGMRHRAKFVGILIVMAGGVLGSKTWRWHQFHVNGLLHRTPVEVLRRFVPRQAQTSDAVRSNRWFQSR